MERGGKRLLLENIIGLVICLDYPRDFQHHPDYTRGGVDPLHDYAPPQSKSGRKFAIGLIFLALVLGVTSNVICGIRCMWPGKHIIYVGQTIRTVHEHSMHKKHKYW